MCPLVRKELNAYFDSPAAYIISVVFLLITGYFFAQPLFLRNQADIGSFTDLAPLLLTFFVPAITMRHFSEEYKSGTIEILMTLPVRDRDILLSKFLASGALLAATLAFTAVYPVSVALLGKADLGAVAGAYAGLWLSGMLLVSAGLFGSTLSRNQVVAFIIAFLIGFSLFLLGKVGAFVPVWLTPYTEFLGLDAHLANLSRGVVDTRDLMYYATGSAFSCSCPRFGCG
ncbi:MAG: ABC transporter permease subunit [Elusimicrobia bacterium]|nr:ABC transporter permease subunit [Elusimicrobiota bacterium]